MRSAAKSPAAYLQELPDARRETVTATRDLVLTNLPDGMVEQVGFGMLNYVIPVELQPDSATKKPLMFAALAAQKNYVSLYVTGLSNEFGRVGDATFRAQWKGAKQLTMGKSCIRFTAFADLDAKLIAESLGSWTVQSFLEATDAARRRA